MRKITTLIIAIIGIFGIANAQGDYEAFTFSQADYLGTARFMGAGGAFGATGGDFSAVSTNPASIGLFKRHEVTFTPMSLLFGYSDTRYYSSNTSAQNFKYTIPQCGIVMANSIRRDSKWKTWQFGFGYNRIMDFNGSYRVHTPTTDNLGEVIVPHANGTDYTVYNNDRNIFSDASLAWLGWMIDTIPGYRDLYRSLYSDNLIDQKATVLRSGGINELTLTVGGNYDDKFFVGATLAFPFLDFKERTTYTEIPAEENDIQGVRSYTLSSYQKNSGTGVNLKLGFIYQPVEFVRIGASFHTPTYYWNIRDNFYRTLYTSLSNGSELEYGYENVNNFTLTTPLKFNVSTSFLIKKRAFIAAEYEFMDYGMASLYSNNYDYTFENEMVKEKYGASHNIRVGAELNVTQIFALRAGYRLKTSPYKLNGTPYNNTVHFISAGLGFRGKFFLFDLAYVFRMSKDSYWLYDPEGQSCDVSTKTHNVVATIGWKF